MYVYIHIHTLKGRLVYMFKSSFIKNLTYTKNRLLKI